MAAKDLLGREIQRGDIIAYPVREGSVMDMVLARVVYERRHGGLEVDRIKTSGRPVGRRKRGLLRRTDRCVIVNPNVSDQLQALFLENIK